MKIVLMTLFVMGACVPSDAESLALYEAIVTMNTRACDREDTERCGERACLDVRGSDAVYPSPLDAASDVHDSGSTCHTACEAVGVIEGAWVGERQDYRCSAVNESAFLRLAKRCNEDSECDVSGDERCQAYGEGAMTVCRSFSERQIRCDQDADCKSDQSCVAMRCERYLSTETGCSEEELAFKGYCAAP